MQNVFGAMITADYPTGPVGNTAKTYGSSRRKNSNGLLYMPISQE
ncbi:MAG: hypothetical protein ACLTTW_03105 [Coprobacter sp.]